MKRIDWIAVIVKVAKAASPHSHPHQDIVNGMAQYLPDMFSHYGITTIRRQAHFLSQTAVESAYFQTLEEYASGDAYDQRTDMGFTPAKDGDGRTNKGFGLIQDTGPNNQRRSLTELKRLGFPVIAGDKPTASELKKVRLVLTIPKYAVWDAGIYWDKNKLNAVADRDSTGKLVGRAVNRGSANSKKPANGEKERMAAFAKALEILQNPPMVEVAVASRDVPDPHA